MVSLYRCNTSEVIQQLFLFQKTIVADSIYIEVKTHKDLFSKNLLQRQSSKPSNRKFKYLFKMWCFYMTNKSLSKTNHTTALIFLTIIFFICGFSAVFNDILIPYLKHSLNISYQSAVLIQVPFYFAYFVSSTICGILCRHRNLLWGIRLELITGFFGTFCIYLASKLMFFSFILF